MRIWDEFKEFAVKGNVMDLAIGVAVGAAFQKIVTSLVNDIILPPVSLITGRIDIANRFVNLSDVDIATVAEGREKGLATLNYGLFIQNTLEFLIIAWVLFLFVKFMNKIRREREALAKK